MKEKSSLINDNEEGFQFFMKSVTKWKGAREKREIKRKVFRIRKLVLNDLPFHYSQKLLSLVCEVERKRWTVHCFRIRFFSSLFHISAPPLFINYPLSLHLCLRLSFFISRYDNQLSTKAFTFMFDLKLVLMFRLSFFSVEFMFKIYDCRAGLMMILKENKFVSV